MNIVNTSNQLTNQQDMLMIRTNGKNLEITATGKIAQFLGVACGLFLLAYAFKAISNKI